MRLPLIGRARVKALHNTNLVPVIAEAGTEPVPDSGPSMQDTIAAVLDAADWVGYNKAGRPYDKRTGRLIKQGRM